MSARLQTLPPPGRVDVVDVPDVRFLMIDGSGSPREDAFARALDAVTDAAHALRAGKPIEPLEALWWWGDANGPAPPDRKEWLWTLLVRQPEWIDEGDVTRVLGSLRERHGPTVSRIRLATLHEGRCVEALHVGPYGSEAATLDLLASEMRRMGYVPAGKHHEVYLDDPRRTPPAKLRTLLRRPVRWTDETQA